MPLLLMHADDFGLSAGVTRGILRAMCDGLVTATSAMVCDAESRALVAAFAGRIPGRVGLHLQLTDGVPILPARDVPRLVNQQGRFPRRREEIGDLDEGEVFAEWHAQLHAFRLLGLEPSHLDTHHTVHALRGADQAYRRLGAETGVPVRGADPAFNRSLQAAGLMCADRYACIWTGGPVKLTRLLHALVVYRRLNPEERSVEIGCHPAFVDRELEAKSRYVTERSEELALLCAADTRRRIEDLGYELATPDKLRNSAA